MSQYESNWRWDVALVQRIVETVADREDVAPADLPPLYHHLDPEALYDLVDSADDGALEVEFVYGGYTVVVQADGTFDVEE